MTVHSVFQMFGFFLEKDKELERQELTLLCEFHLYQTSKHAYTIPRFIVAALWTYFVEVRPNFQPDKGMTQLKREFDNYFVMTQKFFVNSKCNQDFRVRQIKASFSKIMERIIQDPMQKRQDLLDRQLAVYLPSSNDPCQNVPSQPQAIEAVTAALTTTEYSAYQIRDAVISRLNALRHTRASARASQYVRIFPTVSYSDESEAHRLQNFGRQRDWPTIKDNVCAFIYCASYIFLIHHGKFCVPSFIF